MSTVSIDVVSAYDKEKPDRDLQQTMDALSDEIVAVSVPHMITMIIQRLGKPKRLKRLRIFGHGESGIAVIGNYRGNLRTLSSREELLKNWTTTDKVLFTMTHISNRKTTVHITNEYELRLLTPYFAPGGWAELHHCKVAEGEDGRTLLRVLARIWNVLVKGGEGDQRVGGGIENRAVIAYPNGRISYRNR